MESENVSEKCTAYMLAVLLEKFEIASFLRETGYFNNDYVNIEGRTVLNIAEEKQRTRAVAYLTNKTIPPRKQRRDRSVNSQSENS